jgi:sulfotransferase family protein
VTKIYLASPVEPSGASWLINCLLELGVKVSHKPTVDTAWRRSVPTPPPDCMWQRTADGNYHLHPKANVLKKFLPILSKAGALRFRDDVEVEYVQELPASHHRGQRALLFVRDPRDSLYSAYCRQQPAMDYMTFLGCPDPDTLLDRPSQWRLYVESWLAMPNAAWFTFEDYKRDAAELLGRVLSRAGITSTRDDIDRAAMESSYEKARAAEERYRAEHPADDEIINRSGRAGAWIEQSDARDGSALIESRAGDVMQRLGYGCSTSRLDTSSEDAALNDARAFSQTVDEEFLRRTHLPSHRIYRLLESLEAAAREHGWGNEARLGDLRQRFVDGSEHQLSQVRDLLVRQRRTRTTGGHTPS